MKVERCDRCRRRFRGHGDWNVVFIAGYEVGMLCPDCQTPEENAEAVIKEATHDYTQDRYVRVPDMNRDEFANMVTGLANLYPTPEVMRDRAVTLAKARPELRGGMVKLMLRLADDMDSGELWADE